MAEVRELEENEVAPDDADWVFIEKIGDKYVANGSSSGRWSATFYTPAPFESLATALATAQDWCEENDVSVIYVRSL